MHDPASVIEVGEPVEGNRFIATYPPFSCWSESELTAYRRVLRKPPATQEREFGLYVHFPFCERRCRYCYYLSYSDKHEQIADYVDAVVRELVLYSAEPALSRRHPTFVYFGGGTPSLLSADEIHRLASGLQASLSWRHAREVSFECAPRSVTREKIDALRAAGVTRLSLGVQQLDDDVLARNRRVHSVSDVERAWSEVRRAGFEVVNVDLMVGLPGETDESVDRTIEKVAALEPESVTIYQLEMPLNTPLYREHRDGELDTPVPSWSSKRQRQARAFARLETAGYHVRSAYAAVRDPDRHRFVYQEEQYRGCDLLGVGASAFSYIGGVHHQNRAALHAYRDAVERGELPLWRAHHLGDDERLVRELVLQLKLGTVDLRRLDARFGGKVVDRFEEPLRLCEQRGWLTTSPERLTLTREGLMRVDHILPCFYLPRHRDVRYS